MSEKTYPDAEGYDPTVGMGYDIQRFEYMLWFKGEDIAPEDIAEVIAKFLRTRDIQPIQAQYGCVDVPEEDVGEGPYGKPQSSEQATRGVPFVPLVRGPQGVTEEVLKKARELKANADHARKLYEDYLAEVQSSTPNKQRRGVNE